MIFLLMWKTVLLLLYCATASSYPKMAFCVAVSDILAVPREVQGRTVHNETSCQVATQGDRSARKSGTLA